MISQPLHAYQDELRGHDEHSNHPGPVPMVDPGHPDIDTHTLEAAASCQEAAVAWGDTHRSMAEAPRNQGDALSYDDLVEEVEGAVECAYWDAEERYDLE